MRYAHMLVMVAFVAAGAFLTSEALAQWSDGGPERYPLTYPAKMTTMKSEFRVTETPGKMVRASEALLRWSDGGPERYPLTYPPETTTAETDSSGIDVPCDTVRTFEALAQWSDGGPERYPLTYPPETAAMENKTCLAKASETPSDRSSGHLVRR